MSGTFFVFRGNESRLVDCDVYFGEGYDSFHSGDPGVICGMLMLSSYRGYQLDDGVPIVTSLQNILY